MNLYKMLLDFIRINLFTFGYSGEMKIIQKSKLIRFLSDTKKQELKLYLDKIEEDKPNKPFDFSGDKLVTICQGILDNKFDLSDQFELTLIINKYSNKQNHFDF